MPKVRVLVCNRLHDVCVALARWLRWHASGVYLEITSTYPVCLLDLGDDFGPSNMGESILAFKLFWDGSAEPLSMYCFAQDLSD